MNAKLFPPVIAGFEHVNRYWDRRMDMPAAKILPGECYVSAHGEIIGTVLGSCVAACVRDAKIGVGGMNHFMLPVQSSDSHKVNRPSVVNAELCYGNWAMEYLINTIIKLGGRRDRLEVKVFGGGRVLSSMTNIDVGRRNIEFVLDYLDRDCLKIVAKDLGGESPRKVLYFPDTGAVKLKRLRTMQNDTIQKREKAYLDKMSKKPKSGDVELF
ncbi:chemoreceptor glutamine deamidase CheD [Teredinibacter sp. KSP-S5-2]|uniref:chemoreceptor glutamine deamidase CheD n=1 Tax=Teredinibacter sp. KSP-S5-2 TaxID=3034506 RepID=UPI00293519CF|nr:chemoreceptor glutamine deamidase CheD [Teredinibacter sp. KSP-S5-2]WNO07911.1 chemoreceptor glutamine deamidase CheD [Teredinibacter sp. KSP-S5-2]